MTTTDNLSFGKIGKPHGVGGAFFVVGRQDPELPKYKELIAIFRGQTLTLHVRRMFLAAGRLVVQSEEIQTRDDLELWYGAELFVPREQVKMAPDEILVKDLIGCHVLFNGADVGVISRVAGFGAQDNLEVTLHANQKSILIPFMSQFVTDVDIAKKIVVVTNADVFIESV